MSVPKQHFFTDLSLPLPCRQIKRRCMAVGRKPEEKWNNVWIRS